MDRHPGRVEALPVCERGCLNATVGHLLGQARDPSGVLSLLAELLACDEPDGAAPRAGRLDVGGLLAGLPALCCAAGYVERACDEAGFPF